MANLWQQCICDERIDCSEVDYQELKTLIDQEDEKEDCAHQGFDVGLSGGQIAMWSEDMVCVDEIAEEILAKIGEIIQKAGVPYWTFSFANCSDRLIVGESGGGRFRIHSDGSIEWMRDYWPSDPEMRDLVIALLGDEHGISQAAYTAMSIIFERYELDDIQARIKSGAGRVYLPSWRSES